MIYGLNNARETMSISTQHRELVTRLKKPGENILACVTPYSLDLLHMAVGVVGEVLELCEAEDSDNREHVLEELGDLQFYIEGFRQVLCPERVFKLAVAEVSESCDPCNSRALLMTAAGHLLNLTKRFTIYDKTPLDEEVFQKALHAVAVHAAACGLLSGFTPDAILQHNYSKLNTRYPSGSYTDSQAQQRADKN
jgi:NTP pyrophosphatase (non-canonical NTP hydrolase)